jgi:hypothetical protein
LRATLAVRPDVADLLTAALDAGASRDAILVMETVLPDLNEILADIDVWALSPLLTDPLVSEDVGSPHSVLYEYVATGTVVSWSASATYRIPWCA